jgi:hypothetical protein
MRDPVTPPVLDARAMQARRRKVWFTVIVLAVVAISCYVLVVMQMITGR